MLCHTPAMTSAAVPAAVVIATYNRSTYLRECLSHVATQDHHPVQVVVVDSSEGDETAQVVSEFPQVTYLRNSRGRGSTGTAKKMGLEATTAEVVAFLDDDAYPEPSWLGELVRRYDDDAVAAVGGRASNGIDGEEREGTDAIGRLLPDGTLTGHFAADPGHDLDVDHLLGANMSLRRSVVDELGGLQDHYPGTCLREETDMLLRMRAAGHRIVYTPDAMVRHVAGTYAKGRRFDLRYDFYGARNHVVLLERSLGARDPHLRAYLLGVPHGVGSLLRAASAAATDKQLRPRERARAAAGRLTRAGVLTGGTVVGLGVAAGLRLRASRARQPERATKSAI
jgi:GT2 family glycosyltransferase